MASAVEKAELVGLVFKFGSIISAQREFRRVHNRPPPHRNSIRGWYKTFKASGSVSKKKESGRPKVSDETVDLIRGAFTRSPKKSLRRASLQLKIPYSTVQKVVKKTLKFKPYKIQVIHHLKETDHTSRLAAANELLIMFDDNRNLVKQLLFSDEATFHLSGCVNRHNCRIWGSENPHETFQYERDTPKVNVWCALSRRGVIGPYFFEEPTVTGATYLRMLTNFLVPHLRRHRMLRRTVFQQDGAPPHFALTVRAFLNNTFPGGWIGREGPIAWPPRSPDLTPLDFYMWGYVKNKVYATRPANIEELKNKIRNAIAGIPALHFVAALEAFQDRLRKCIASNGGHVEIY